jgi:hypothetical protein
VARGAFKISAALEMLRPRASIISVLIRSPGWVGLLMGISPPVDCNFAAVFWRLPLIAALRPWQVTWVDNVIFAV